MIVPQPGTADPPAAAHPAPFSRAARLARLGRLARKELRETLRDRRTLVTLLLMPLLVYPVLSLAFRQFLLSSFEQPSALPLRIATRSQEEWTTLMSLLSQGDRLVAAEGSAAAARPLLGGPILGADLGAAEPPLSSIQSFVAENLEAAVRSQEIDLGVLLLPSEGERGSKAQVTFQLLYRPGAPLSRQAASFVERRLRAVNEHDLLQRLDQQGHPPLLRAAWRLKPIADEEGHAFWLGTLVPLVLILMTITGAVYPAIDLTAGERERGTLEALMAAPVPRLALLFAKYVAVLTVAMLTALVNLTAMMVTIASSGLGPILFGARGLAPGSLVAVLLLLMLFAAFFAALLLSITSFARSFKEAQAYLIPLMVVSLAPGFLSVMPGLHLGPLWSVVPLANIVLLARDVLQGEAALGWGAVAVLTTLLYASLALSLAARIFGSDAILYGSELSWSDLFHRRTGQRRASLSAALATLAVVGPLYVLASGLLAQLQGLPMSGQLCASAASTLVLFALLPLGLAYWQGVRWQEGFQLRPAPWHAWLAAMLLGASLWPLAYNLLVLCQQWGLATWTPQRLAEHRQAIEELALRLRQTPLALLLVALAVVPAVAEELFFRGYLLEALRGRLPGWAAIGATAALFGLFHASLGGLVALERIPPSTLLGLALGWLCWQSGSVLPGMLLHGLHNAWMLMLLTGPWRLPGQGQELMQVQPLAWPLVALSLLIAAMGAALMAKGAQATSPALSPHGHETGSR
jgi:ABC-2 type transport system permease protein/sodium transport system permease protein